MNRLIILAIALLPSLSFGLPMQQLADAKVTHLQLMINNLNVLMFSKMVADEEKAKTFEKFTLTANNQLVLSIIATVPVTDLTRAKCIEIANERVESIKSEPDNFFTMLSMSSMYELDRADVQKLLDTFFGDALLVTDVNKELSVHCQNAK